LGCTSGFNSGCGYQWSFDPLEHSLIYPLFHSNTAYPFFPYQPPFLFVYRYPLLSIEQSIALVRIILTFFLSNEMMRSLGLRNGRKLVTNSPPCGGYLDHGGPSWHGHIAAASWSSDSWVWLGYRFTYNAVLGTPVKGANATSCRVPKIPLLGFNGLSDLGTVSLAW